ncbi:MAG: oligosaccharide flippase family protein [Verrucomicrobiia bacterium]
MSHLRQFWSAGALLLSASVGVNAAAYVFQAVLARWLTDDDFGAVKWANDWLGYVMTPVVALQVAMTRYAAVFDAQADPQAVASLAWRATRRLAWYAAAFLLFMAAAQSWLMTGFRLTSPGLLWAVAGLVVAQLTVPVTTAVLQGLQRFRWLAIVGLAQSWGRVVFGLGLVALGFGAVGALGGQLLAAFMAAGLALWALRALWHHRGANHGALDTRPIYRYFWPALVVSFGVSTMGSLDMSFVRHYFEPSVSGQFGKAKMIAQAFGCLVAPLATVLFPKAASDAARGESHAVRALWQSLGATLVVGVAAATACSLWPWLPVRLLAGPNNPVAEAIVAPFVWAMLPLALLPLPVQFFMARADFKRLLGPLAMLVVAYPAALWLWHDTLLQILAVSGVAGASALVSLIWSLSHVGK